MAIIDGDYIYYETISPKKYNDYLEQKQKARNTYKYIKQSSKQYKKQNQEENYILFNGLAQWEDMLVNDTYPEVEEVKYREKYKQRRKLK